MIDLGPQREVPVVEPEAGPSSKANGRFGASTITRATAVNRGPQQRPQRKICRPEAVHAFDSPIRVERSSSKEDVLVLEALSSQLERIVVDMPSGESQPSRDVQLRGLVQLDDSHATAELDIADASEHFVTMMNAREVIQNLARVIEKGRIGDHDPKGDPSFPGEAGSKPERQS